MRLGDVKAAWKANMQSFDIRNALPESEETWSGVSENYQLMGRAFGILRNYEQAKKCFGASNELARKAHYAQIICDNCCNLLALSMQMDMADEVESLTKELKHLLTEENQMSGRWKQMKIAIDLYWQMRAARNASDGELSK